MIRRVMNVLLILENIFSMFGLVRNIQELSHNPIHSGWLDVFMVASDMQSLHMTFSLILS
jgi:hypothetical protein